MNRRRFLLTSLAGAAITPRAAGAQQAGKIWRIGYLSLVSGELEQYPFRIEVHVETGASASHDQLLSKRQANAIKDYLVKQYQLSPRRLATDGRGSAQPIKQTNPASPVNRRVVVVNTSSSEE